jgi:photosystem II stability/assembly factor-like uncharacterized protein
MHRFTAHRIVLALAAIVGYAMLTTSAKAAVSVGSSSWHWQNPQPQGNFLNAISCPGTSGCYAVGNEGTILYYNGTNWSGQISNVSAGNLHGITCPSTSTCFAVGDFATIVATTNGGATWTKLNSGVGGGNITGISCPTTSVCFALGPNGVIYTDLGTNSTTPWEGLPGNGNAISCPSTTECYLTENLSVSRLILLNGFWTLLSTTPLPTLSGFGLTGISCVSSSTCAVSVLGEPGTRGANVIATSNFGTSWTSISAGPNLTGISCISTLTSPLCYAVGLPTEVFTGSLTRASWSSQPLTGNLFELSAISCQPAFAGTPPFVFITGACSAVGNDGAIETNTPSLSTWTSQRIDIAPSTTFRGVSCPQTGTCYAVGGAGLLGSINGSAWKVINPHLGGSAISCPTTEVCFAANSVDVAVTTNGGASYTSASALVNGVPTGGNAISCPSTEVCVAAGQYIIFTNNGGASWTAQQNFGGALGVSCPSTTECVVVGLEGVIVYTTNLGPNATWTVSPSGTANNLNAVSCPTATSCFAIGNSGTILAGTFNGNRLTWVSQPPAPSFGTDFYSISCLPASGTGSAFCEASGANSQSGVIITGPGTWQVETAGFEPGLVTRSMSCTGLVEFLHDNFECATAGDFGTIMTKTIVSHIILGTGDLTPSHGNSEVGDPTTFTLTWTVPSGKVWRDLGYVELKLADDDGVGLWARFIPGLPNSVFALLDGNGNIVAEGVPGTQALLDSPSATLDLGSSSFEGTGPTGPTVTVNFVVGFKPGAVANGVSSKATRVYDVYISAADLSGNVQVPEKVGSRAVRANH